MPTNATIVRAGLVGGLTGGGVIWLYEAIVWVGVQRLMPLAGIPRNATGLVFGRAVQDALGGLAYAVGIGIHFTFAALWGVAFAFLWHRMRHRGVEVTLIALAYAAGLWMAMHAAIVIATADHPNYTDPNVVIGGIMSHFFYTVPLGLIVKRCLARKGNEA